MRALGKMRGLLPREAEPPGNQSWSPRAGQPLGSQLRSLHTFRCRKLNQVQEIGDWASGRENEELDGVKCCRGMSGTQFVFPELSGTGRCEVVRSPSALPGRFSTN